MPMDSARARRVAKRLEVSAKEIVREDRADSMRLASWRLETAIRCRIRAADFEGDRGRGLYDLMRGFEDAKAAAKLTDMRMLREGLLGKFGMSIARTEDGDVRFEVTNTSPDNEDHAVGVYLGHRIVSSARENGKEDLASKYERKAMELWRDRARIRPHISDISSYLFAREMAERIGDEGAMDEIDNHIITSCGGYGDYGGDDSPLDAMIGYKMAVDYARVAERSDLEDEYTERLRRAVSRFGANVKPEANDTLMAMCELGAIIADGLGDEESAERLKRAYVESSRLQIGKYYGSIPDSVYSRSAWILDLRGLVAASENMGLLDMVEGIESEIARLRRFSVT